MWLFPCDGSTIDREDAVSENPLLSLHLRDLQGPDTLLHLKNAVRGMVSPCMQLLYRDHHQDFSQRLCPPCTHVHFAIPVLMDFTYDCAFNKVLILTLLCRRKQYITKVSSGQYLLFSI